MRVPSSISMGAFSATLASAMNRGMTNISSRMQLISRAARARLPHSRRWAICISGQVAMVIMVAQTRAGRKGRSTMKHEMMSRLRNSRPRVILAKSTFSYALRSL